jgi:hypothetical protein
MTDFTKKVDLIWQLDFADNYQFDNKGDCYNVKSGRQIKRTVIGYTEGYCINGKFKSLFALRKRLIKINKINCPF